MGEVRLLIWRNRKGKSVVLVVIVGLLLVGISFLGGWFARPYFEKTTIPPEHQTIIDQIDITHFVGDSLTCELLKSSKDLAGLALSEWGYYIDNYIDNRPFAYLYVNGPYLDDGFVVRIGIMVNASLTVECPEGTFALDEQNPILRLEIYDW